MAYNVTMAYKPCFATIFFLKSKTALDIVKNKNPSWACVFKV